MKKRNPQDQIIRFIIMSSFPVRKLLLQLMMLLILMMMVTPPGALNATGWFSFVPVMLHNSFLNLPLKQCQDVSAGRQRRKDTNHSFDTIHRK